MSSAKILQCTMQIQLDIIEYLHTEKDHLCQTEADRETCIPANFSSLPTKIRMKYLFWLLIRVCPWP